MTNRHNHNLRGFPKFVYYLLCGENLEANIDTSTPSIAQIRYTFLNIQGAAESTLRKQTFEDLNSLADILVLSETNAKNTTDEKAWTLDWKNSASSFWASHKSHGRGMAILIKKTIPTSKEKLLIADPNGRHIAIHVELFGIKTIIIGFHADPSSPTNK